MEINITKIIKDNLKVDMVFQNPGGGISKIASINDEGTHKNCSSFCKGSDPFQKLWS